MPGCGHRRPSPNVVHNLSVSAFQLFSFSNDLFRLPTSAFRLPPSAFPRRHVTRHTSLLPNQRFFFPRVGITLFTAPATDDAIVATTPFFCFRFDVEPPDRFPLDFVVFDPALDLDVDFDFVALDFPAAFLAIADTATPRAQRKENL
jgi:hypothetical protein